MRLRRLPTAALSAGIVLLTSGLPDAQTRGGRSAPPPIPPVADVKLDRVTGGSAPSQPRVTRNPFRFYEPPPAAVSRGPRPVPPPPPTYQPPPGPAGPPPPPPISLRFIGLIEAPQRAGRVALLSDGRGGLMNGREGDIIEGRFRLLRVGTDSLDIAYADGRGRQTVRLSGQ